eukprot:m.47413 g.47413  ORF g.47413 m.47413 type:complete len:656 (+) comp7329_c2_seq1:105-2072(+)
MGGGKSKMKDAPRKGKKDKKGKKKKEKKGGRHAAQRLNRGRLYLETDLKGNTLNVTIGEAREFDLPQSKKIGAFVTISFVPEVKNCPSQKTDVVETVKSKVGFEKLFKFELDENVDVQSARLIISMENAMKNHFMGSMSFALGEIMDEDTPTSGWFKFLDEKKGVTQNEPFRVKKKNEITPEMEELYASAAPQKISISVGKVSLDSFDYIKVLGRGAFGKVLLAEHKETKEQYAIKALSKENVIEEDDVLGTMIERRVLALGTACKCLTGLYATFQSPARLYFVMEFISGGDLLFHLENSESFTELQVQLFAAELAVGLWFLHEHGVIYRDLKLENVMLTADGHVKLADFGLCKEEMWGAATTTTFCGTPTYLAPEIIREEPYGFSVDWWSYGVMCYEMLVGESPFEADDVDELFDLILDQKIDYPPSLSPASRTFLSSLLVRNPNHRLGCGDNGTEKMKKHAFFNGLSWDDVSNHQVPSRFSPSSDTSKNFDASFLKMDINETPTEQDVIDDIDQLIFYNFSFVKTDESSQGDVEAEPVPAGLNRLQDYDWYRPDLDRAAAAKHLHSAGVGKFIVRESKSKPGCYAITVALEDGKFWNGVVSPGTKLDGSKYFKVYPSNKFDSIPELVNFYINNPISAKGGRPIVLVGEDDDDE